MRARAFAAVGRQMLSLASAASPTKLDTNQRKEAVGRVLSAVRRVYAEGTLDLFGSAATNLSLPGSDLDLVVTPHGPPPAELSHARQLTHVSSQAMVAANYISLLKERLDRLGRTQAETSWWRPTQKDPAFPLGGPGVEKIFTKAGEDHMPLYSCTACLNQHGGPTAVSDDNHTKKRSAEQQACQRLLEMLDDELPVASTEDLAARLSGARHPLATRRATRRATHGTLAPLVPHIRSLSAGKRLLYLSRARVPIISFIERRSGVHIDLSAERTGMHNSAEVRKALAYHAELRPLLLVHHADNRCGPTRASAPCKEPTPYQLTSLRRPRRLGRCSRCCSVRGRSTAPLNPEPRTSQP